MRTGGHRLYAFSNGSQQSLDSLLRNSSLLAHFDSLVSADSVRSFKPDPTVYLHFFRTVNGRPGRVWLVAGNPWDVIGAKSAGLRAAWLNRGGTKIFGPWSVAPDITLSTLGEFAAFLTYENGSHAQKGATPAQDRTLLFIPNLILPCREAAAQAFYLIRSRIFLKLRGTSVMKRSTLGLVDSRATGSHGRREAYK